MKKRNENSSPNYQNKLRMLVFLLLFFTVTVILIVRLGYIQLIKGNDYKKAAMENWARDISISAKRGTIYDTKGKKLAVSMSTYTVVCIPKDVQKVEKTPDINKAEEESWLVKVLNSLAGRDSTKTDTQKVPVKKLTLDSIAKDLSQILEIEYDDVYKKITSNVTYVEIKRFIEEEQAEKIRALQFPGVNVIDDNKRVYPYGAFASYLLGFTDKDQNGLYGIESKFNEYMTGVPGRMAVNTDAHGMELPYGYGEYYEPKNGYGIVTTVDEAVQHFAESAAVQAVKDFEAERVTIVAMEPKTGDVLAMTSKPDYDPNNPRSNIDEEINKQWEALGDKEKEKKWNDMWRNPAVNDLYEPGSTFKLITVAAALEVNKTTPNSSYYCDGYVRQVKSYKPIKCWRYYNPHGQQTLSEVLQNSCNDALAEIGLAMGKDDFHKYIRAFGYGEKTNIRLNGEAIGIVKNPKTMTDVDVVTQSFGQSISVSPIQMITAVSALTNGGSLMEPRLVKQLIDEDGNIVRTFEPVLRRKVVSEDTSKIMLQYMKDVTEAGSHQGYIPGYRVGGKTGTAQKVVNGQYSDTQHVMSYIGVAPVDDPKIAILVIVDSPNESLGQFGSTVAGPVFKTVMESSLKYLGVEPIYTPEEQSLVEASMIAVPQVAGLTVLEAMQKLDAVGLSNNFYGMEVDQSAAVKSQFPKPGEKVMKGSIVTLTIY